VARKKARIPNRHTLGIDEAGRGPSVGPMVMAAVAIDSKAAAALTRRGLTDSKTYGAGDDAHAIRCDLAAEVRKRALFVETIVVSHTVIDERVSRNELNVLERECAIQLIEKAPTVDKIIADGKRMFMPLCQRYAHFESRDRAEEHHARTVARPEWVEEHERRDRELLLAHERSVEARALTAADDALQQLECRVVVVAILRDAKDLHHRR